MNVSVLTVPGIGNSGPDHWQSLWEMEDETMVRLHVDDWDYPSRASWVKAIDGHVRRATESLVVVAHSLGCLAFAHWAARHRPSRSIRGALLVAVPDPGGPNFPSQAEGFSPVPLLKFPCSSIVVSSQDDPYGSPEYSKSCADAWGSTLIDIGRAGHINGDSHLGDWAYGRRLLEELRAPSGSMWGE
jgi:predicted alpha/beta hydrolase family esterase